MTSEKLNSYLSDIDNKAKDMFSWLVKELSEKENVTENFKCENQICLLYTSDAADEL